MKSWAPDAQPITAAIRTRAYRSSLRQFSAGLLADHVLGVPVGPVRVGLSRSRLMLPVRSRRTPKGARQIGCRCECCRSGANAARQARGNFLKQPAVPVRIMKRSERAVAAMLRIRTADTDTPEQVGLVRPRVHSVGSVEHLADRHAVAAQLVAGSLDVGNDH